MDGWADMVGFNIYAEPQHKLLYVLPKEQELIPEY
jgi:hypothetical protein